MNTQENTALKGFVEFTSTNLYEKLSESAKGINSIKTVELVKVHDEHFIIIITDTDNEFCEIPCFKEGYIPYANEDMTAEAQLFLHEFFAQLELENEM